MGFFCGGGTCERGYLVSQVSISMPANLKMCSDRELFIPSQYIFQFFGAGQSDGGVGRGGAVYISKT